MQDTQHNITQHREDTGSSQDDGVGWPTTVVNDEFATRSIRYLASAGYRDDAIVSVLTTDLGMDPARAVRLVAAAATSAITVLRPEVSSDPAVAGTESGFPPAA